MFMLLTSVCHILLCSQMMAPYGNQIMEYLMAKIITSIFQCVLCNKTKDKIP